jgi:hypothetical protein
VPEGLSVLGVRGEGGDFLYKANSDYKPRSEKPGVFAGTAFVSQYQ